jgi:hypothetical protein
MVEKNEEILIKKQWFIGSLPGKIENYYSYDPKKVWMSL